MITSPQSGTIAGIIPAPNLASMDQAFCDYAVRRSHCAVVRNGQQTLLHVEIHVAVIFVVLGRPYRGHEVAPRSRRVGIDLSVIPQRNGDSTVLMLLARATNSVGDDTLIKLFELWASFWFEVVEIIGPSRPRHRPPAICATVHFIVAEPTAPTAKAIFLFAFRFLACNPLFDFHIVINQIRSTASSVNSSPGGFLPSVSLDRASS